MLPGLSYLTWILFGLFFLFGFAMLTDFGLASRETWGGLCVVALGAFALSVVKDALTSGQVLIRLSFVRRASQPRLFWIVTLLYGATGVVVLIGGIWMLFFRT